MGRPKQGRLVPPATVEVPVAVVELAVEGPGHFVGPPTWPLLHPRARHRHPKDRFGASMLCRTPGKILSFLLQSVKAAR